MVKRGGLELHDHSRICFHRISSIVNSGELLDSEEASVRRAARDRLFRGNACIRIARGSRTRSIASDRRPSIATSTTRFTIAAIALSRIIIRTDATVHGGATTS